MSSFRSLIGEILFLVNAQEEGCSGSGTFPNQARLDTSDLKSRL
jgi:hypothetical protein